MIECSYKILETLRFSEKLIFALNTASIMDFSETYWRILYKIIRKQNKLLLKEISLHEHIPLKDLHSNYLPKMTDFKNHLRGLNENAA
jgi:hypothetical protein